MTAATRPKLRANKYREHYDATKLEAAARDAAATADAYERTKHQTQLAARGRCIAEIVTERRGDDVVTERRNVSRCGCSTCQRLVADIDREKLWAVYPTVLDMADAQRNEFLRGLTGAQRNVFFSVCVTRKEDAIKIVRGLDDQRELDQALAMLKYPLSRIAELAVSELEFSRVRVLPPVEGGMIPSRQIRIDRNDVPWIEPVARRAGERIEETHEGFFVHAPVLVDDSIHATADIETWLSIDPETEDRVTVTPLSDIEALTYAMTADILNRRQVKWPRRKLAKKVQP